MSDDSFSASRWPPKTLIFFIFVCFDALRVALDIQDHLNTCSYIWCVRFLCPSALYIYASSVHLPDYDHLRARAFTYKHRPNASLSTKKNRSASALCAFTRWSLLWMAKQYRMTDRDVEHHVCCWCFLLHNRISSQANIMIRIAKYFYISICLRYVDTSSTSIYICILCFDIIGPFLGF